MYAEIGAEVQFSKTVGETDIYLFAGITGDFSGNHVNEEYMRQSAFGRRIAHGALLVGFMSTTSSLMIEATKSPEMKVTPVSLGYDHVRFVAPVYIGDTVTVRYRISEVEADKARTIADITVKNQDDTTVAVARHILKWVPNPTVEGRAEANAQ